MSLAGLTDWGATPTLEAMIRFAGERQRLIAHNIANINTPNFNQLDLSPTQFQQQLSEAVDKRRKTADSEPLELEDTGEVTPGPGGSMSFNPSTPRGGILRHDRNNSDLERLMQDQAENLMVYRQALDLLKSRSDLMRSALAQRV